MTPVDIRCRNCAHGKVWHQDEGRCYFDHECDCEAWDYGVNVDKFDPLVERGEGGNK